MAVDQLPGQVREFANYLDGLLARLDQGGGWCGVFWQRDPDGMQACLSGREVPPWDVVEALLQDLAAEYGPGAVAQEKDRARALHMAALAAFDARPGSRDALSDRLDVMLREQKYAAERQLKLGQLLNSATTQDAADALRLDLAWAHDDHERATARCAELRARIEELDSLARTRGTGTVQRDRHGNVFRVDDVPAAHRLPRQRDPEDRRHGYDPAGADHQGGEPRRRDNRRGYEEFERANPGFDGRHATPDFGRPEPTSGRGTPDPAGGGFGSPETASGFGAPDPMDDESTGHTPAPDQAAPRTPDLQATQAPQGQRPLRRYGRGRRRRPRPGPRSRRTGTARARAHR